MSAVTTPPSGDGSYNPWLGMFRQHYKEFRLFIRHTVQYAYMVRGVLICLLVMIFIGGLAISHFEGLELSESIYFAFVTGLTIGYGDISPTTPGGRLVAILIGMVGILFTGMTIAIATRALVDTAKAVKETE